MAHNFYYLIENVARGIQSKRLIREQNSKYRTVA